MNKDIEVKKRGWVKNAAIVFLSIMLVLTFFSQTIMNRSLPEVAVVYTQPGSITSMIRGTGTVVANEIYEVMSDRTQTVGEVPVRVGDTVSAGDTLIVLAKGESAELAAAEEELYNLELQLEKMLITSNSDYTLYNRAIQNARDKLTQAQKDRDAIRFDEAGFRQAETSVNILQTRVDRLTSEFEITQQKLKTFDSLHPGVENSSPPSAPPSNALITERNRLLKVLEDADVALINAEIALKQAESKLAEEEAIDDNDDNIENAQKAVDAAQVVVNSRQASLEIEKFKLDVFDIRNPGVAGYKPDGEPYSPALAAEREGLKKAMSEAEALLSNTEIELMRMKIDSSYNILLAIKPDWDAANNEIKMAQLELTAANEALADFKRMEETKSPDFYIDVRELNKKIDEKRDEIAELKKEGTLTEIKSPVGGVIKSITVTPGHTTTPETPLMVIDVVDRGYSLSIPVTAEQSTKVQIGEYAQVDRGWFSWGEQLYAVLSSVRADPQNPAGGRVLVFSVWGDNLESNTQLNITMAQRSENYAVIVPNSAVRTDTNGSFVLVIESRNTPLGNRHIATRRDVTVLASDDTQSAVGGSFSGWEYVITTSTRPIEPGMQVRLADNP
ncbi:MAG: hypothetical protein FWH17_01690 [Oscillospiraceae bacterium]|nr:hypothetical protein [Oscillospiraceae bacterium]